MTLPLPDLPAPGSTDWYAYMVSLHAAVNTIPDAGDLGLATVATSGAYADLTGKPTIPQDADDLGLATVATTGDYADLSGLPTLPAAYADEQARDAVGAALVAGSHVGITATVTDGADTINLSVIGYASILQRLADIETALSILAGPLIDTAVIDASAIA